MDEKETSPNQAPDQSRHGDAAFVGRRRELETLTSALEDAAAERGRVLMLAGTPGSAKPVPPANLQTWPTPEASK